MTAYRFIEAEKANHSIRLLCEVLKISRAAFYAWRSREPGTGALELRLHIRSIHREMRSTYGSPRITCALRERGLTVNHKRVARLMRLEGLRGIPQRRFRVATTKADPADPVTENVLQRRFTASAPNRAWVADITYLPVTGGWAYLAVQIDLFSRKVVGWALDNVIDTGLCLRALRSAVATRRPPAGLIHHSDRGCQYTSREYREELSRRGILASMSRRGDCWDNAVAESFFGTLKQELRMDELSLPLEAMNRVIRDYIHDFYNSKRLHSANDYMSPINRERQFHQQAAKPA